eukprot:6482012-Amphidinium_carterae.1
MKALTNLTITRFCAPIGTAWRTRRIILCREALEPSWPSNPVTTSMIRFTGLEEEGKGRMVLKRQRRKTCLWTPTFHVGNGAGKKGGKPSHGNPGKRKNRPVKGTKA